MNRTQDRTLGDTRTEQKPKWSAFLCTRGGSCLWGLSGYMNITGLQWFCRNVSSLCSLVDGNTMSNFLQLISVSRAFFPAVLWSQGWVLCLICSESLEIKRWKVLPQSGAAHSLFFFFLNLFHLNCWCFLWQEFLIELQLFLWHIFFISFTNASDQSLHHHQTRVALQHDDWGSDLRLNSPQPT